MVAPVLTRLWRAPGRRPPGPRLARRLACALGVLATTLLSGGADAAASAAGGALADLGPFASFESRCQGLPQGRLEVLAAPVEFGEDYGESLRTLSQHREGMSPRHRTIGLTQARLGYEFTLESRGLEDRRGGRVCARPSIQLVFSATPMTVYVARELADDDCRRSAIRDHELKHVAVYRDYLAELVRRADVELPRVFGDEVIYARDAEAARHLTRRRLQAFMQAFMQPRYAELKARQAAIDTPDEYERLAHRCGALPQG